MKAKGVAEMTTHSLYQRILVPLDGSSVAEAVLPQVQMLAECSGAEVVLLSVTSAPAYDYYIPDAGMAVELHEKQQTQYKTYLERVCAQLKAKGLNVRAELCSGGVAESILDYADSIQADLIAMSTHGRNGLGRFLLGSVAEKVIRSAKVPVLLVRPR
jgi:nucleotide-binding universal stress UspA family protein